MEHLEKLREEKRKLKKQILVLDNIFKCEIQILNQKRFAKVHPDFTEVIKKANLRIEILEKIKTKLRNYLQNLQNDKEI